VLDGDLQMDFSLLQCDLLMSDDLLDDDQFLVDLDFLDL